MRPTRLLDKLDFSPRRFLPQLLYGSQRVRAFLLCLEPGQGLPARRDSEEMLCYVVEGEGSLTVGDEVLAVSAGDFAAAAPGEVRGLQAEQRMTVLWLQLGGAGGQHE
jgi:quercetin dioxygenase-like cupin family protein